MTNTESSNNEVDDVTTFSDELDTAIAEFEPVRQSELKTLLALYKAKVRRLQTLKSKLEAADKKASAKKRKRKIAKASRKANRKR